MTLERHANGKIRIVPFERCCKSCYINCYIKIGRSEARRIFTFKVSEYPFKENKNTLKIIQVLLYTHFYNISLNVLRPNFLNICNLPISHFPNIRKIRVKVGPKNNYFSCFMSSCTDRIVVFNNFFHLYLANQGANKTLPVIFSFSNIV